MLLGLQSWGEGGGNDGGGGGAGAGGKVIVFKCNSHQPRHKHQNPKL